MSGTNSNRGTGGYGGASMAIPMAVLVLVYPPLLIIVLVVGIILIAVVALRSMLH